MFAQKEKVSRADSLILMFNALFLGAGILANLGFEEIGLDLYVVALLAILSSYLLWKRGRQPLFIYYTFAYWLGLVASIGLQVLK